MLLTNQQKQKIQLSSKVLDWFSNHPPEDALVNITIYDMMGRTINNLVTGKQSSDFKSVDWNATSKVIYSHIRGFFIFTTHNQIGGKLDFNWSAVGITLNV